MINNKISKEENLDIKLVSGKIKIKSGIGAISTIIIMILLLILSIFGTIYYLLNFDLKLLLTFIGGALGTIYLSLISPYTQKSSNYYLKVQSENSLTNFELFYKGKLVYINHKFDSDGKFAFTNNDSKLSCISYDDGSKMNNFTKYKIINYFVQWLGDNNLLSTEVTTTLEK